MKVFGMHRACTRAKRRLNRIAPRMADAAEQRRNAIADQRLAILQQWWRMRHDGGHTAMQYLEKHHSGLLRHAEGSANRPNSETTSR